MFLCMTDDLMDALDFFDTVGIGLCKASRDDDGGMGVEPDGLTDGLARLHGCLVRDGAGVDDTDTGPTIIGCLVLSDPMHTGLLQCMGDGFGFKLVDLAAEGDDGKGGFFSCLSHCSYC